MVITWQERIALHPFLTHVRYWPVLLPTCLRQETYENYLQQLIAVQRFLAGEPMEAIQEVTGISQGQMDNMLRRTLGGEVFSMPKLTFGLIPGKTVAHLNNGIYGNIYVDERSARNCALKLLVELIPGMKCFMIELLPNISISTKFQRLFVHFQNRLPRNLALQNNFHYFYSDEGFSAFHTFCYDVLRDGFLSSPNFMYYDKFIEPKMNPVVSYIREELVGCHQQDLFTDQIYARAVLNEAHPNHSSANNPYT